MKVFLNKGCYLNLNVSRTIRKSDNFVVVGTIPALSFHILVTNPLHTQPSLGQRWIKCLFSTRICHVQCFNWWNDLVPGDTSVRDVKSLPSFLFPVPIPNQWQDPCCALVCNWTVCNNWSNVFQIEWSNIQSVQFPISPPPPLFQMFWAAY